MIYTTTACNHRHSLVSHGRLPYPRESAGNSFHTCVFGFRWQALAL